MRHTTHDIKRRLGAKASWTHYSHDGQPLLTKITDHTRGTTTTVRPVTGTPTSNSPFSHMQFRIIDVSTAPITNPGRPEQLDLF